MKVLLVVPYQTLQLYVVPNVGLGYVAGALRRAGHEVDYLDCAKEGVGRDRWAAMVRDGDHEVIGIQCFTFNYSNVKEMFVVAKEARPGVVTVCGGAHANAAGIEMLAAIGALDFAVSGEGERAAAELCDALASGGEPARLAAVPNLVWRDGPTIRRNAVFHEPDLDELASPAWDLMAPGSYPPLGHGILNRAAPQAPLFATRGCPYPCTFCSAHANMGKKLRVRSPEHVVDEVERLVRDFGVRELVFDDDNFTLRHDFALGVSEELIRRELGVVWSLPNGVRLDSLDTELLVAMERAGCYSFAVGVESGSDRVLGLMRKRTDTATLMERIRLVARTTRIRMTGFFMAGFPGETLDDLAATERFIMTAPFHRLSISLFVPLPATVAHDALDAQGLLDKDPDWTYCAAMKDDDYVSYCDIPTDVLVRRVRRVSLRFYLRPHIAFGLLREIHTAAQLRVAFEHLAYLSGLSKLRYW